jgi:hypothetical protein
VGDSIAALIAQFACIVSRAGRDANHGDLRAFQGLVHESVAQAPVKSRMRLVVQFNDGPDFKVIAVAQNEIDMLATDAVEIPLPLTAASVFRRIARFHTRSSVAKA